MPARGIDHQHATTEVGFELLGALDECGQDAAERHVGGEELERAAPELLKPLCPLRVGDVDQGTDEAACAPIRAAKGLALVEDLARSAVRIGDRDLFGGLAARGDERAVRRLKGLARLVREVVEFEHRLADEVFALHPEGHLIGGVAGDEGGVWSFDEDGVGQRVEQGRLQRTLLLDAGLAEP